MEDISILTDDELKNLAMKVGLKFDWHFYLSPRYQLIEALRNAGISEVDIETRLSHFVEIDYAGSGYPRLTCHTCNDTTLLRKPYMSALEWREAVCKFTQSHPSRYSEYYNEKA